MKKLFIFKLMIIAISVTTLISCNDDDDDCYYVEQQDAARGTITNASPNSGSLDFFSDENKINSSALNYTDTFGYYNFYIGKRTFSIKNNAGDIVAQTDIDLKNGDYFSVFAVNTFNNIELVSYNDFVTYPKSNNAVVRFINLSSDSEAIDIKSATKDFAADLSFKEDTKFVEVSSGFYDFTFYKTGTGQVLFSQKDFELRPGRIYTIYTKGFVTPPSGSNDTFSTKTIVNF